MCPQSMAADKRMDGMHKIKAMGNPSYPFPTRILSLLVKSTANPAHALKT